MKRLPAVLTIAAVSATVFILLKDDSLDQAKSDCVGWPDDPQVSLAACDVLLAEHLSDTTRGNVLFYKALAHDLDEDYPTAMASYDEAATLIPQKRSPCPGLGKLKHALNGTSHEQGRSGRAKGRSRSASSASG